MRQETRMTLWRRGQWFTWGNGRGDGIVSQELLKLMFTVNDEMVEKMIAALTPDVENAPIKFKAMSREQRQWLDDMWDLWDADGSGELDKYELQEARVLSRFPSSVSLRWHTH
jgi:hypothetical protein